MLFLIKTNLTPICQFHQQIWKQHLLFSPCHYSSSIDPEEFKSVSHSKMLGQEVLVKFGAERK